MSKEKKILFYCTTPFINVGSYRIWVHDLNNYFKQAGIQSEIANPNSRVEDHDIIICGKEDAEAASKIKTKYPERTVGVINLSAEKKNLNIDFVIVGSLEEMDSLSTYENVFLFPLIENMFQNCKQKEHIEKDVLRIGYHGHYPHLSKFEPHLKSALEYIDKICDIELLVVTTHENINWQYGRPNIKNIAIKKWGLDTIKQNLMTCDVGVVPNVTYIDMKNHNFPINDHYGMHSTDHVIRMKNKSNAGRSFVFHQLGIPIVTDLTPSNFHILGDPRCGTIAFNKQSWIKGILKYKDPKVRTKVAKNAKEEFDRLYNPISWAERLYFNIRSIKK